MSETLKIVPPPPRMPEEYVVLKSMEGLHDGALLWFPDTTLKGFGIYISYISDEEFSSVDVDLIKKKSSEVYKAELEAYKQAVNERNEIMEHNQKVEKKKAELREVVVTGWSSDPEYQEYLRLKEKYATP